MNTRIQILSIKGNPEVLSGTLPVPMRIGDVFKMGFQIQTREDGRVFELTYQGPLRVVRVGFDLDTNRQVLQVEPVGKPPVWKAIKKEKTYLNGKKFRNPAKSPSTPIE